MVKSAPYEASTQAVELADDLGRIYRDHSARMWRALTAFSGCRELAQDAVAEAFAQAVARGPGIHDPERWIWKAAYRIAAGDLHRRRRETGLSIEPPTSEPEPAWEIRAALARLPQAQRSAVVLHYYAGYSARDIAAITETTSGAVWMALSRGRKELRRILEASDE